MKFTLKNDLEIHIAEGEALDAKDLIAYVKVVADESQNLTFCSDEFNVSVEEEKAILEKFQAAPNSIYALAKYKNQIIGEIRMASSSRARTKHTGEFGMSVSKAFWNQGLGSALMHYLIKWAKSNELTTKINLEVRTDNKAAIQLYRKFNFKIEGTHKNEFLIDKKYYDTYSMGLVLED